MTRKALFLSILATLAILLLTAASRPPDLVFDKLPLHPGANETAAIADLNGDRRADIILGEYWFEAPSWRPHRFREIGFSNNYIDNFSDLPLDVDSDGLIDVVSCSWFSRRLAWWKNPGPKGDWKEAPIETGAPIEFCFLIDADNDGKAREILPQFGDAKKPLAWYEFKDGKWHARTVAANSYGHGIGAGDVNGDGRTDILTPKGWFEAPADPRSGAWTHHSAWLFPEHLGFMHVLDVNSDGRPDILTSNAHDYGIFWLEAGTDGKFTKRLIDDSWSQAHAVTLADFDGDGFPEILTGKRYMAHNGKDPGEREPLGIYMYRRLLSPSGQVSRSRHVIDYSTRAGGGMQLPVGDLDGDGDLDFVAPGKAGAFIFLNTSKPAPRPPAKASK